MKFDPNSTDAFVLLKAGKCKFKVIELEECTNKYGDSFKLTLKLKDSTSPPAEGKVKNVWVNTSNIRDFLLSINKLKLFGTGDVQPRDIINAVGSCVIGYQDFYSNTTGKRLTGLYVHTFQDIDIIPEHLAPREPQDTTLKQSTTQVKDHSAVKQSNQSTEEFNDDVPF